MAQAWKPGNTDLEFGQISKGYVVRLPDFPPDSPSGHSRNQSNAYLEDHDQNRVFMWVNEYASDFAMAGSTAQSKKRREFFPHNFTQPSMTISGQTPNQYEHARLAEFIRKSQKECIIHDTHTLDLVIQGGGTKTKQEVVKGVRDPVLLTGYISNAQRTAMVGENAPDFSFQFVVLKASKFIGLHDQVVRAVKFRDILDVIEHPSNHWEFQGGGVPTVTNDGSHPQNGGESTTNSESPIIPPDPPTP
jgi:hypothetical protein